jgi:MSHA biogenesis protein MshG
MPLFSYKGRTARGELVSGRIDGDTPDMVASRLFSTGVTPVEINVVGAAAEGESGGMSVTQLSRTLGLGRVRTADLVLFSRQMYTITKSGIPLLRGLRGLVSSTHNAILRETLEDVLMSLEGGRDLSASLGRHPKIFPTLYVSIIRVGEATGTLEKSFLRLTEYLGQDKEMQDRMKSAIRYPIIVMITIVAAMAFLSTFVIPKFAPIFAALGNNIPLPTRIIMGASTLTREYWWVMLGLIAVIVIIIRRILATVPGRYQWDRFKLQLPAVGRLTHEAVLARISRSLAISLSAGMPMIQTLAVIARSTGNAFLTDKVLRLRDNVERGEPLSRAASATGMFSPLVIQMMSIGEETGELSELLDEAAGFYEREVDHALKNLSSAIEPILIVVVGGMVLLLALGIFLPLWEMISRAGAH